jgi:hypothetical protein
VEDAHVLAAEVAQQGEGGAPTFPDLGKSGSGNGNGNEQLGVPDEGGGAGDAELVNFQENGLLEGVSTWRFRCVFGGILLGYFVSL